MVSRLSLGSIRDLNKAAFWLCEGQGEESPASLLRRALKGKLGFGSALEDTEDEKKWVSLTSCHRRGFDPIVHDSSSQCAKRSRQTCTMHIFFLPEEYGGRCATSHCTHLIRSLRRMVPASDCMKFTKSKKYFDRLSLKETCLGEIFPRSETYTV